MVYPECVGPCPGCAGPLYPDHLDTILDIKQSPLKVTYKPYDAKDARRLVQNRIGCPKLAAEQLGFKHDLPLRQGLQKLIDWRNAGK